MMIRHKILEYPQNNNLEPQTDQILVMKLSELYTYFNIFYYI
jgi:MFS superfamily sulfate permease-like transporter